MSNSFWVVWNPRGRNPSFRHRSEGNARQEAKRLARQNPGDLFFVLEARASYVLPHPSLVVEEYGEDAEVAPEVKIEVRGDWGPVEEESDDDLPCEGTPRKIPECVHCVCHNGDVRTLEGIKGKCCYCGATNPNLKVSA